MSARGSQHLVNSTRMRTAAAIDRPPRLIDCSDMTVNMLPTTNPSNLCCDRATAISHRPALRTRHGVEFKLRLFRQPLSHAALLSRASCV
ncbi:hypothetical protein XA68_14075 [Ophiocordyceps unilateralis]|uniref:Uncharacterized protein n=1 Tax=Ophiocordyceps unilateralis TaxID=268505 RepID=A0A2A9PAZ0_OPHUN|nr:hypothetical protein XA68_14075 [Ophiocordyceps unilateralis]